MLKIINHSKSLFLILGLVIFCIVPTSCTNVPIEDFTSYKNSINEVKVANEKLLIEYSASISNTKLKNPVNGISPRNTNYNPENLIFVDQVDHIAVRLQAWEILLKYNNLIEALMVGKSKAEIEGITSGLISNLEKFPISKVADVVSDISPVIGLLNAGLEIVQREFDRQKALDSFIKAAPEISKNFVALLRKDAVIFYNTKLAFSDKKYIAKLGETTNLIKRYIKLVSSIIQTTEIQKLSAQIDTIIEKVGKKSDGMLIYPPLNIKVITSPAPSNATPLQMEQFQNLKNSIKSKVEDIIKLDNKLLAYQGTINAYLKMITELDSIIKNLVQNAKNSKHSPPDHKSLIESVIRLKSAYESYKRN